MIIIKSPSQKIYDPSFPSTPQQTNKQFSFHQKYYPTPHFYPNHAQSDTLSPQSSNL